MHSLSVSFLVHAACPPLRECGLAVDVHGVSGDLDMDVRLPQLVRVQDAGVVCVAPLACCFGQHYVLYDPLLPVCRFAPEGEEGIVGLSLPFGRGMRVIGLFLSPK